MHLNHCDIWSQPYCLEKVLNTECYKIIMLVLLNHKIFYCEREHGRYAPKRIIFKDLSNIINFIFPNDNYILSNTNI